MDTLTLSRSNEKSLKSRPVAESWEDEEAASSSASSDSDTAARTNVPSIPNAPPPTPISPSVRSGGAWGEFPSACSSSSPRSYHGSPAQSPTSRPEKSTSAAGRMIAGALGLKTPKKSEEAQAYERAAREKELRKMAKEREERKAEDDRRQQARRQVWED